MEETPAGRLMATAKATGDFRVAHSSVRRRLGTHGSEFKHHLEPPPASAKMGKMPEEAEDFVVSISQQFVDTWMGMKGSQRRGKPFSLCSPHTDQVSPAYCCPMGLLSSRLHLVSRSDPPHSLASASLSSTYFPAFFSNSHRVTAVS